MVDPGDPNDPHRWFVFTPPYFFLPSIGFDPITSENFRASWQWEFDAAAGQVGVIAMMDCDDADDIDYASIDAHVDVVMSFTPPVAGVARHQENLTIGRHYFGHLFSGPRATTGDAWAGDDPRRLQAVPLRVKDIAAASS